MRLCKPTIAPSIAGSGMRRIATTLLAHAWLSVAICGCVGSGRVAARVGKHELTAERLAQILSHWRVRPLRSHVAEQVTNWWVEFQLFGQRVVAGDSLLDSATVTAVMWSDARGYVLARFREQLLSGMLPLDSALVDSAYTRGDHRLIQHVLIRADSGLSPSDRAHQRRRADDLAARLQQGAPWGRVSMETDDQVARGRGGSIGVIRPGETVSSVEQVAFALRPGEISALVESPLGFHILRRPPLAEIRNEYAAGLEDVLPSHVDSIYRRDLLQRRRLQLEPDALQRVRDVLADPLRYTASNIRIASFHRGRFTLRDVVRWLRAIPDWMHARLERGTPEQVAWFLETMMGYELMYREASEAGVTLSAAAFAELRQRLAERLWRMQTALEIRPPIPGESTSTEELALRARQNIESYLATLEDHWDGFERVPMSLVEQLKSRSRWAVYPRGVEQGWRRALELQTAGSEGGAQRRAPG